MAVAAAKGKMEALAILVDQAAADLVVEIHREHQEVMQLNHLLVVGLDMVFQVVMGKLAPHIEVVGVEAPVLLEVLDHQLLEMDLVVMGYKHHHHLEILQVQLVIRELMVVEVLQLLVVTGLLVAVDLVEHHIIHYKEMVVLVVEERDMVVGVIEIFHHQLLESKIQVEVVVDFA